MTWIFLRDAKFAFFKYKKKIHIFQTNSDSSMILNLVFLSYLGFENVIAYNHYKHFDILLYYLFDILLHSFY